LGLEELRNIDVSLMTAAECIDWMSGRQIGQMQSLPSLGE